MKINTVLGIVTVLGVIGACFGMLANPPADVQAAPPAAAKVQLQPVEPDMHEFMEYVFQPTYQRLKAAMAAEPADNSTWKTIKADSLILAEGGNLLLARPPESDVDTWNGQSIAVRTAGGELYQAAKKKDYQAALQHYKTMLTKCNACHDHFADGEHQLSP